jgi:hypothetical protein
VRCKVRTLVSLDVSQNQLNKATEAEVLAQGITNWFVAPLLLNRPSLIPSDIPLSISFDSTFPLCFPLGRFRR